MNDKSDSPEILRNETLTTKENLPENAPEPADTDQEGSKGRFKLSVKYATMSFTYWFASCFGIYLTTFLVSNGWQATQVGLLNSVNSAVGAVSSPVWGTFADKIRSVKKIIITLIIAAALTFALIPFMDWKIAGISLLFILVPLSTFFKQPLGSLVDNWTVRSCNKHGLNFGAIRSFGSISFGIVGLVLGYLIPKINAASKSGMLGTTLTFPLYSAFSLVLLVVVLSTKEDSYQGSTKKSQSFREMHFGQLFTNYYYMTYLVYAMIIQIPLSCVFSFFSYLLKEINVDINMIGYVQGLKAFIEIPMLLLMDKVRNKVPLYYLLIASGILYLLEALFYSMAGTFTHIMLICMLQGLAGGLHIAAGSNYVATLAPENLKATAQTLNGSMVSIAGILGNAIGGFVIQAIGIRTFYRLSAFILLGALTLYILSFPFGEKVLHLKRPQIVKHGAGHSH